MPGTNAPGRAGELLAALAREGERKQQMRDEGTDPADPAGREAREEAHPGTLPATPPRLPRYGHAVLTGETAWDIFRMGAYVVLEGTPGEPRLHAQMRSGGFVAIYPERKDLVRFAREILAFLGEDYGVTMPPWRPANNGAGQRPWFLTRYSGHDDTSIPLEDRYHYSGSGVLVRYGSYESAQRAAGKLNKAGQAASADGSTRALDAIACILSQDWPGDWARAMEQRADVIRVLRAAGRDAG